MNTGTKRRSGDSPSMRAPGGGSSGRGIFGLILCLLVPPLGLMFLWRKGVFRVRGRMLLTALATVEMMIIAVLLTPHAQLDTVAPIPGTAVRTTPAPESQVKNALSDIEQLLYEKQLEEVLAQGGSEKDLLSEEEQMALIREEQEAVLNTIVYCYSGSGARFYHLEPVCGNQSNRRELTVEEAMLEGMGACPDCDPPVYGFVAE